MNETDKQIQWQDGSGESEEIGYFKRPTNKITCNKLSSESAIQIMIKNIYGSMRMSWNLTLSRMKKP